MDIARVDCWMRVIRLRALVAKGAPQDDTRAYARSIRDFGMAEGCSVYSEFRLTTSFRGLLVTCSSRSAGGPRTHTDDRVRALCFRD